MKIRFRQFHMPLDMHNIVHAGSLTALKARFIYDRPDRPDRPSRLKKFRDDLDEC